MKRKILGALAAVALMASAGHAAAQSKEPLKLPFPYIFSGPLIEFGERVWNEGLIPGVANHRFKFKLPGNPLQGNTMGAFSCIAALNTTVGAI